MDFKLSIQKEMLLDPVGGFDWHLQADFDDAKADCGVGSSARAFLGEAILCSLVGFEDPARRLFEKSSEWIRAAIEMNERPERYFPGGTEADRFRTQSLCNWFLTNKHDAESLQKFVQHNDVYLNSQVKKDKVGVSLALVTYLDARAFERALEIFKSTAGLTAPTKIYPSNESDMSYIFSRHILEGKFNLNDIDVVIKWFLKRNIERWLCEGHMVRAVEWLKVLFWNETERAISAEKVLMRSFDFIQGHGH